jgi:hypothetical protein
MHIFDVLAPTMAMIALGAWLGWIRFLGKPFIGELNKLAFWVALPSLIFRAAAHAGSPSMQSLVFVGVITAATLLTVAVAWAVAAGIRIPSSSRGTFVASSFFGDLAYIGLPILAHSLGPVALGDSPELLATALIAMTGMTVFNNALAASLFRKERFEIRGLVRLIVTNPIVIAGCLGIGYGMTGLSVPYVFDDVLRTLGATAVPLALISIGGSLEMTPLRGRISWIACASALQVIVFPLIAWVICRTLNLDPADSRIVLIFCACPTAAVTYTMASQMGGDEALATGAIAMSTVASFVSLAVVLGIT